MSDGCLLIEEAIALLLCRWIKRDLSGTSSSVALLCYDLYSGSFYECRAKCNQGVILVLDGDGCLDGNCEI